MFAFSADLEIGGSLFKRSGRLFRFSYCCRNGGIAYDGFLGACSFGVRTKLLCFQVRFIRAFRRKAFRAHLQREGILVEGLAEMLAEAEVSAARIAVFAGSAKQFM